MRNQYKVLAEKYNNVVSKESLDWDLDDPELTKKGGVLDRTMKDLTFGIGKTVQPPEVKQVEKGAPQYHSWTFFKGGRYKDNGSVSEEELSDLLRKGYKEYISHVWVDTKGSNTWVVDEVNVDKAWLIRKLNRIHQEKGGQPNLIDVKKGSKLPFQDIIKKYYA